MKASKRNKLRQNQFFPDYAVPPGETFLETIDAVGMSQAELAERAGISKKTINEIITGKAAVTPGGVMAGSSLALCYLAEQSDVMFSV